VFVALVIRHAIRMRHIVIFGLSVFSAFSKLSHEWHDFRKKMILHKNVFWFSLHSLHEKFLIPIRSERDMIINVCCYSCKILLFLSDFKESVIFSTDICKIYINANANPYVHELVGYASSIVWTLTLVVCRNWWQVIAWAAFLVVIWGRPIHVQENCLKHLRNSFRS